MLKRLLPCVFVGILIACVQSETLETRVETFEGIVQSKELAKNQNPALDISVFGAPIGVFNTTKCKLNVQLSTGSGHLKLTVPEWICKNDPINSHVEVQRTTYTWTKADKTSRSQTSWRFVQLKN